MKDLTWTERYNIHRAKVGSLEIIVAWNSTAPKGTPAGFDVSFGGRRLGAIIADLRQAKIAGVKLARRTLKAALAELPPEGLE